MGEMILLSEITIFPLFLCGGEGCVREKAGDGSFSWNDGQVGPTLHACVCVSFCVYVAYVYVHMYCFLIWKLRNLYMMANSLTLLSSNREGCYSAVSLYSDLFIWKGKCVKKANQKCIASSTMRQRISTIRMCNWEVVNHLAFLAPSTNASCFEMSNRFLCACIVCVCVRESESERAIGYILCACIVCVCERERERESHRLHFS